MNTKYIFVTGGVVSGLGKGITAASLGRLLKNRGYNVTNIKMDPYINYDSGTMNPMEHGECFVTMDGAETDLDLGHYERFTGENLTGLSSITTGKIYKDVIDAERRGDYLGKTVQAIPHITDAIKNKIYNAGKSSDIVIVELGGTIGDIEGLVFAEAVRQIESEKESVHIHVTLLPFISGSNELKTKPTQHSVKELQSLGIKPDILVCRCDTDIDQGIRNKLALFCSVKSDCIIENKTVGNLYEVPLMLENEGLANKVCQILNIRNKPDNSKWEELVSKIKESEKQRLIKVAIVGKYCSLADSYLSVTEAIKHACYHNNVNCSINYVFSDNIIKDNVGILLSGYDAIIVPGGFGDRGIEGMIYAIQYARENKIPFLGICLGMQLSVVEFMRNVVHLEGTINSEEFDRNANHKVIHIMEEQRGIDNKGGTMRLGAYKCNLSAPSMVLAAYGHTQIVERHRHRLEFNNEYRHILENSGMSITGVSPDGNLVEVVELKDHPFFIGCQFHPELQSRPDNPAPLFYKLIEIAKDINIKED